MTEKIVLSIYNILSVIIWTAVIGVFIFVVVLFCTGENRAPVFKVNSVSVSAAQPDDAFLAEENESANGWYVAECNVTVTGAALSPFTYTAEGVAVFEPSELCRGKNCFAVLSESIVYSKSEPADFTVFLYIKSDNSVSEIAETVSSAGFGLRRVTQSFSFFSEEIQMNLPHFSLSDFPQVTPTFG